MSRLIDADRLLIGYKDHDFVDTHIIWNAPTVDAIPVQWLEDRALTLDIASMESVFRLLDEWRNAHAKAE